MRAISIPKVRTRQIANAESLKGTSLCDIKSYDSMITEFQMLDTSGIQLVFFVDFLNTRFGGEMFEHVAIEE